MVTRVGVTVGAPGSIGPISTMTFPAGYQRGDRATIPLFGKYETASQCLIDQGWSPVTRLLGGTGAQGNDTGPVQCQIFQKDLQSSSEPSFTITAGATPFNSWTLFMAVHRPGAGMVWRDPIDEDAVFGFADDTNTASPLTGTCTPWTGFEPTTGDAIFAAGTIPTDTGSALGATTLTATGLSGGTKTTATSQYVENALGADSASVWAGWTGFTGPASAGLAVSMAITSSTNHSGLIIAHAIREMPAARLSALRSSNPAVARSFTR